MIANLSASNETVSKDDYRMLLVKSASARLLCGYIYTSAGEGESTQDLVFGGHDLIAENGTLLINDEPTAPLPAESVRPEYLTAGEFTVPEGCFFLLGDNLEHSIDSRYAQIGLAEERGMVGKVLT